MFKVTPQLLLDVVLRNTDFVSRYPDAERLAIDYDFDTDCFHVKFRHDSLEEINEGDFVPVIEPPEWRSKVGPAWWAFWARP
jgi:hypothetical protein